MIPELWEALDGDVEDLPDIACTARGMLPSAFAVTDLAAASVGVAGAAIAELVS